MNLFSTLAGIYQLANGSSVGSALGTAVNGVHLVDKPADVVGDIIGDVADNSAVGSAINNALGNEGSDSARSLSERNAEMAYNSEEAEKQRLFELYLSNTAYSRAIADLRRNGINPYAVLTGLNAASSPSGASASYSGYAASNLSANSSVHNARLGVVNSAISALARLGTIAILRS